MKVYVLTEDYDEGHSEIVGIFTTEELAKEEMEELVLNGKTEEMRIEDHELTIEKNYIIVFEYCKE